MATLLHDMLTEGYSSDTVCIFPLGTAHASRDYIATLGSNLRSFGYHFNIVSLTHDKIYITIVSDTGDQYGEFGTLVMQRPNADHENTFVIEKFLVSRDIAFILGSGLI